MVQSMNYIPVAGPSITARELDYVADAAANGWYAGSTTYHERFEKAFAEYLGVRYAVSLPSCTSAIHLAPAALNVGQDDEVIVPDVTWIALVRRSRTSGRLRSSRTSIRRDGASRPDRSPRRSRRARRP